MSSVETNYYSYSDWFFYKSPTHVANDLEFCAIDTWGDDTLKFFNTSPQVNQGITKVCKFVFEK